MDYITNGFCEAVRIIFSLDKEFLDIVMVSIMVAEIGRAHV